MTKGFLCFFAVARRFYPAARGGSCVSPVSGMLGIRPWPRGGLPGCRAGDGAAAQQRKLLRRAGPVSSYSTAEERMMVASIVPSAAGACVGPARQDRWKRRPEA